MPCSLLIRATTHAEAPTVGRYKGDPQTLKDGDPWGIRLPDFVILHITDATADQVRPHLDAIVNTFEYEIQAENENGWRIRVSVNPAITRDYGPDKGIRNDMRDMLVADWGSQVFDYDNVNHEYAVMDFPKPLMYIPTNEEKTLLDLKADVHDKFETQVFRRRYHFSESDVDQVLGLGGKVDQTLAQVNAKVIDRLD